MPWRWVSKERESMFGQFHGPVEARPTGAALRIWSRDVSVQGSVNYRYMPGKLSFCGTSGTEPGNSRHSKLHNTQVAWGVGVRTQVLTPQHLQHTHECGRHSFSIQMAGRVCMNEGLARMDSDNSHTGNSAKHAKYQTNLILNPAGLHWGFSKGVDVTTILQSGFRQSPPRERLVNQYSHQAGSTKTMCHRFESSVPCSPGSLNTFSSACVAKSKWQTDFIQVQLQFSQLDFRLLDHKCSWDATERPNPRSKFWFQIGTLQKYLFSNQRTKNMFLPFCVVIRSSHVTEMPTIIS